jgi:hypothetical protein
MCVFFQLCIQEIYDRYFPEITQFRDFDAHNFNIWFIPNDLFLQKDSVCILHSVVTQPWGCVRSSISSMSKATLHISIKLYVNYPSYELSNEFTCNYCALLANRVPCDRPIRNSTRNSSNFWNHFMVQKQIWTLNKIYFSWWRMTFIEISSLRWLFNKLHYKFFWQVQH